MSLRYAFTLACLMANVMSFLYLKYSSGRNELLEWLTTAIVVLTFISLPMILAIVTFKPDR